MYKHAGRMVRSRFYPGLSSIDLLLIMRAESTDLSGCETPGVIGMKRVDLAAVAHPGGG
jgi:hypothetical protein